VTVPAGHAEGSGGQVFGLAPPSRTVAGVSRRFWAGMVDDHVRALPAAQHDDPFEHICLRPRPPEVSETLALDQPEAVVAYTDSDVDRFDLASTAPLPPEVVRRTTDGHASPRRGAVPVPGQDHLLFHVLRDRSVDDVFEPIVRLTHRLYDEVHERISPELYFHLDGAVTQVTRTGDDGDVVIDVDGSFADALQRVRHIG